ncbi:MAG: hypothetical protein A2078_13550 [Nitrospirae bacterium GWC2_57_9]|nr:MAG: hypothetical protein A2078_13550 [Nitrospirae bacterium GWC2_57_9]
MLKRASSLLCLLSVFVLLTAMGGKGGGFERVPRVDRNFSVTVTDITGNKIEGEKFSWEGRIRFSGYMGMAEVNLPFDKIKEVTIGEKRDRKVRITARLQDGTEAQFDMDADARCYGEAGFGSFMLMMSEIKSVVFKGVK